MKNAQNLTIVLLVVTASILTSLLVAQFVYTQPDAYGVTCGAKGGDYIMATGQYNQDMDFIYILDIANNKLNIYYPNINTNSLVLGDSVDLALAFRGARNK